MMRKYTIAPFILFIKAYRLLLSPLMGQQCRFYPTCSHYSEEALQQHGVMIGGWLTIKRIAKCAPWHPGGIDHLPRKEPYKESPKEPASHQVHNFQPTKTAISE